VTHPYPELGCLVIAHLEVRDELREALLDELLGDVSQQSSPGRGGMENNASPCPNPLSKSPSLSKFPKLAAWYLHTTPKRNHTRENIKYTGIPIKHFHAILIKTISTEWKFWERTHNHKISEISREQYTGSAHDSTFLNKSPIKDIMQWDRKIAHMGYLPDTFKDFPNIMGIPKAKTTQTENNICTIMRKHTYQMFKTYWRQCHLLKEKGRNYSTLN
jgi:hypothetical protein